jgi:hypothetical protein
MSFLNFPRPSLQRTPYGRHGWRNVDTLLGGQAARFNSPAKSEQLAADGVYIIVFCEHTYTLARRRLCVENCN